ncbi:unnamed protein product, partial [Effrenium voratum]
PDGDGGGGRYCGGGCHFGGDAEPEPRLREFDPELLLSGCQLRGPIQRLCWRG